MQIMYRQLQQNRAQEQFKKKKTKVISLPEADKPTFINLSPIEGL